MELLLGLTDSRDVYLMRHLLTYLVFLGGVFAVYRMATRRFDDWRLGLCAATMLVLSPRFFAEAFYNSKDVVFMACFAMATNTMLAFVTRPGIRTASLHALATAVAIDVRVAAILLVPMTLGLGLVEAIKRRRPLGRQAALAALFLGVGAAVRGAAVPVAVGGPGRPVHERRAQHVVLPALLGPRALHGRQHHARRSAVALRARVGRHLHAPAVRRPQPRRVPSATLAAFARRHVRLWADEGEMQDLVFLSLACAPPLLVMTTHAVVYDGWRHLYFIYPSLLLLAMRGLVALWTLTASVRVARATRSWPSWWCTRV